MSRKGRGDIDSYATVSTTQAVLDLLDEKDAQTGDHLLLNSSNDDGYA